jgi:hypothetical protein
MTNFINGKIYKLISNFTEQIYIGSTCQTLPRRKAKHKNDYKRYKEGKCNYMTSYELLKLGDIDIILIENYCCLSKKELLERERHFIENSKNCINEVIPIRTDEEKKEYYNNYKEINKDRINKRQNQYTEEHKEIIKDYQAVYREINKDSINERQKKYNKAKKEEISINKKIYYEANKERIKLKAKQRREERKNHLKL